MLLSLLFVFAQIKNQFHGPPSTSSVSTMTYRGLRGKKTMTQHPSPTSPFQTPSTVNCLKTAKSLSLMSLTDDLQIHFLQLNHLQVTAETLYNATPIERWRWFLRHAQELTTEQVSLLLPEPEFSEAARVL
ncbi:MAG: hypothetical protein RLZZ458_2675, partial [Planctomycetota bacterium]